MSKLDTSHLILKPIMVNGKLQHRWVDPNTDKEHAPFGSKIKFEHHGKEHFGTVGSVIKTGEYAVKGENGTVYNKHRHQFELHKEDKNKEFNLEETIKDLHNKPKAFEEGDIDTNKSNIFKHKVDKSKNVVRNNNIVESVDLKNKYEFRNELIEQIYKKYSDQLNKDTSGYRNQQEILHKHAKDVKLEKISLKDLSPDQDFLTKKQIIKNLKLKTPKPIVIIELGNGEKVIVDGHHRAASEILKGNENIDAYVIRENDLFSKEKIKEAEKKNNVKVGDFIEDRESKGKPLKVISINHNDQNNKTSFVVKKNGKEKIIYNDYNSQVKKNNDI